MSSTLTSTEKRELRSRAQRLEAGVKLGHAGFTEAWLKALDHELTTHELVKVRFTDQKEQRKQLAPQIAEKSGSELITIVGNVAVYFRRKGEGMPTGNAEG